VDPRAGRGDWLPALALALGVLLLTWPVVLLGPFPADAHGSKAVWAAFDQNNFHLPAIRAQAEIWPIVRDEGWVDAAPGYYFVRAGVMKYAGAGETALRLLSSLFGALLIVIVWRVAAVRVGAWAGAACVAPLLGTPYLLAGSIWLTTDNAAWCCVAPALSSAAGRARSTRAAVAAGMSAALAVFVRQMHVWLVVPLGVAALGDLRGQPPRQSIARLAPLLLPLAALGVLVWFWGGLVPLAFAGAHVRGVQLAVVPYALALVGFFGVFFWGAFGSRRKPPARGWHLGAAVAAVAAIWLAVPTSYDLEAGRYGGVVWELAYLSPAVASRSLAILALGLCGAITLVRAWEAAVRAGCPREARVMLAALAALVAAQSVVSPLWPRYFEVYILLMLAWLAAFARRHEPVGSWIVGPVVLGCGQLALSVVTLYLRLLR
jgi:hypothetical protein